MNILQRGLRKILGTPSDENELLANGSLADKRAVEDPTGKFHTTRYITQVQRISSTRRNVEFMRPEYDLPTIANAIQMDGILQRSVNLFTEQILKNGYEYISKNDRVQRHVNRRMKEIQNLTGNPFYELMNGIARQLVTYGNAYVIKVRSSANSRFGRQYRLYNRNFNPIVGLFVADATTIQIGINSDGQVVNYKQLIGANEIFWDERDVIHIAYNKIPGTLTGMSSIIPVLDDVRALRKLEEEIEILGFQYSIPLYLYKVGTKDLPPAPGEIDQAMSTINNMPAYGMLVVPGHHTIEVPSNNNAPIDILSFVNHFKKRIFAGLGVSPVAMGEVETSNRNTSEVMDISMQTITKRYQQLIKYRLEIDLFRELMMDGRYDPTLEQVEFTFPEIDLEAQIKKETNIIQKWQNNILTREEARIELDKEKRINEQDTFLWLVDIPKIEAEAKAKLQIELAKPRPAGSTSSSAKRRRTTDVKIRPQNQHGKSTGRPKFVKNTIDDLVQDSVRRVNVMLSDGGNKSTMNITRLSDRLTKSAQKALRRLLDDSIESLCDFHHINDSVKDEKIINDYLENVNVIIKDKISRSAKNLDNDIKVNIFARELSDFLNLQRRKADSLAKLLVYKSLGFMTILVNAEDCQNHTETEISSGDITYSRIPPFKYSCNCRISEKGIYEFNEISTEFNTDKDQGDSL